MHRFNSADNKTKRVRFNCDIDKKRSQEELKDKIISETPGLAIGKKLINVQILNRDDGSSNRSFSGGSFPGIGVIVHQLPLLEAQEEQESFTPYFMIGDSTFRVKIKESNTAIRRSVGSKPSSSKVASEARDSRSKKPNSKALPHVTRDKHIAPPNIVVESPDSRSTRTGNLLVVLDGTVLQPFAISESILQDDGIQNRGSLPGVLVPVSDVKRAFFKDLYIHGHLNIPTPLISFSGGIYRVLVPKQAFQCDGGTQKRLTPSSLPGILVPVPSPGSKGFNGTKKEGLNYPETDIPDGSFKGKALSSVNHIDKDVYFRSTTPNQQASCLTKDPTRTKKTEGGDELAPQQAKEDKLHDLSTKGTLSTENSRNYKTRQSGNVGEGVLSNLAHVALGNDIFKVGVIKPSNGSQHKLRGFLTSVSTTLPIPGTSQDSTVIRNTSKEKRRAECYDLTKCDILNHCDAEVIVKSSRPAHEKHVPTRFDVSPLNAGNTKRKCTESFEPDLEVESGSVQNLQTENLEHENVEYRQILESESYIDLCSESKRDNRTYTNILISRRKDKRLRPLVSLESIEEESDSEETSNTDLVIKNSWCIDQFNLDVDNENQGGEVVIRNQSEPQGAAYYKAEFQFPDSRHNKLEIANEGTLKHSSVVTVNHEIDNRNSHTATAKSEPKLTNSVATNCLYNTLGGITKGVSNGAAINTPNTLDCCTVQSPLKSCCVKRTDNRTSVLCGVNANGNQPCNEEKFAEENIHTVRSVKEEDKVNNCENRNALFVRNYGRSSSIEAECFYSNLSALETTSKLSNNGYNFDTLKRGGYDNFDIAQCCEDRDDVGISNNVSSFYAVFGGTERRVKFVDEDSCVSERVTAICTVPEDKVRWNNSRPELGGSTVQTNGNMEVFKKGKKQKVLEVPVSDPNLLRYAKIGAKRVVIVRDPKVVEAEYLKAQKKAKKKPKGKLVKLTQGSDDDDRHSMRSLPISSSQQLRRSFRKPGPRPGSPTSLPDQALVRGIHGRSSLPPNFRGKRPPDWANRGESNFHPRERSNTGPVVMNNTSKHRSPSSLPDLSPYQHSRNDRDIPDGRASGRKQIYAVPSNNHTARKHNRYDETHPDIRQSGNRGTQSLPRQLPFHAQNGPQGAGTRQRYNRNQYRNPGSLPNNLQVVGHRGRTSSTGKIERGDFWDDMHQQRRMPLPRTSSSVHDDKDRHDVRNRQEALEQNHFGGSSRNIPKRMDGEGQQSGMGRRSASFHNVIPIEFDSFDRSRSKKSPTIEISGPAAADNKPRNYEENHSRLTAGQIENSERGSSDDNSVFSHGSQSRYRNENVGGEGESSGESQKLDEYMSGKLSDPRKVETCFYWEPGLETKQERDKRIEREHIMEKDTAGIFSRSSAGNTERQSLRERRNEDLKNRAMMHERPRRNENIYDKPITKSAHGLPVGSSSSLGNEPTNKTDYRVRGGNVNSDNNQFRSKDEYDRPQQYSRPVSTQNVMMTETDLSKDGNRHAPTLKETNLGPPLTSETSVHQSSSDTRKSGSSLQQKPKETTFGVEIPKWNVKSGKETAICDPPYEQAKPQRRETSFGTDGRNVNHQISEPRIVKPRSIETMFTEPVQLPNSYERKGTSFIGSPEINKVPDTSAIRSNVAYKKQSNQEDNVSNCTSDHDSFARDSDDESENGRNSIKPSRFGAVRGEQADIPVQLQSSRQQQHQQQEPSQLGVSAIQQEKPKTTAQQPPMPLARQPPKVASQRQPRVAVQKPNKPSTQQEPRIAIQRSKPVAQQTSNPVVKQPAKPAVQQKPNIAVKQKPKIAIQQPPKIAIRQPPKVAVQMPPKIAVQQPKQPAGQQNTKPVAQHSTKPVSQLSSNIDVRQPPKLAVQQPTRIAVQQPQKAAGEQNPLHVAQHSIAPVPKRPPKVAVQQSTKADQKPQPVNQMLSKPVSAHTSPTPVVQKTPTLIQSRNSAAVHQGESMKSPNVPAEDTAVPKVRKENPNEVNEQPSHSEYGREPITGHEPESYVAGEEMNTAQIRTSNGVLNDEKYQPSSATDDLRPNRFAPVREPAERLPPKVTPKPKPRDISKETEKLHRESETFQEQVSSSGSKELMSLLKPVSEGTQSNTADHSEANEPLTLESDSEQVKVNTDCSEDESQPRKPFSTVFCLRGVKINRIVIPLPNQAEAPNRVTETRTVGSTKDLYKQDEELISPLSISESSVTSVTEPNSDKDEEIAVSIPSADAPVLTLPHVDVRDRDRFGKTRGKPIPSPRPPLSIKPFETESSEFPFEEVNPSSDLPPPAEYSDVSKNVHKNIDHPEVETIYHPSFSKTKSNDPTESDESVKFGYKPSYSQNYNVPAAESQPNEVSDDNSSEPRQYYASNKAYSESPMVSQFDEDNTTNANPSHDNSTQLRRPAQQGEEDERMTNGGDTWTSSSHQESKSDRYLNYPYGNNYQGQDDDMIDHDENFQRYEPYSREPRYEYHSDISHHYHNAEVDPDIDSSSSQGGTMYYPADAVGYDDYDEGYSQSREPSHQSTNDYMHFSDLQTNSTPDFHSRAGTMYIPDLDEYDEYDDDFDDDVEAGDTALPYFPDYSMEPIFQRLETIPEEVEPWSNDTSEYSSDEYTSSAEEGDVTVDQRTVDTYSSVLPELSAAERVSLRDGITAEVGNGVKSESLSNSSTLVQHPEGETGNAPKQMKETHSSDRYMPDQTDDPSQETVPDTELNQTKTSDPDYLFPVTDDVRREAVPDFFQEKSEDEIELNDSSDASENDAFIMEEDGETSTDEESEEQQDSTATPGRSFVIALVGQTSIVQREAPSYNITPQPINSPPLAVDETLTDSDGEAHQTTSTVHESPTRVVSPLKIIQSVEDEVVRVAEVVEESSPEEDQDIAIRAIVPRPETVKLKYSKVPVKVIMSETAQPQTIEYPSKVAVNEVVSNRKEANEPQIRPQDSNFKNTERLPSFLQDRITKAPSNEVSTKFLNANDATKSNNLKAHDTTPKNVSREPNDDVKARQHPRMPGNEPAKIELLEGDEEIDKSKDQTDVVHSSKVPKDRSGRRKFRKIQGNARAAIQDVITDLETNLGVEMTNEDKQDNDSCRATKEVDKQSDIDQLIEAPVIQSQETEEQRSSIPTQLSLRPVQQRGAVVTETQPGKTVAGNEAAKERPLNSGNFIKKTDNSWNRDLDSVPKQTFPVRTPSVKKDKTTTQIQAKKDERISAKPCPVFDVDGLNFDIPNYDKIFSQAKSQQKPLSAAKSSPSNAPEIAPVISQDPPGEWKNSDGGVIDKQLERMRENLKRMTLPDWFRKSPQYDKLLSGGNVRSLPSYWTYNKPKRMTASTPATPTGERKQFSTQLPFLTAANFRRRDFSKEDDGRISPANSLPDYWTFGSLDLQTQGLSPNTSPSPSPNQANISGMNYNFPDDRAPENSHREHVQSLQEESAEYPTNEVGLPLTNEPVTTSALPQGMDRLSRPEGPPCDNEAKIRKNNAEEDSSNTVAQQPRPSANPAVRSQSGAAVFCLTSSMFRNDVAHETPVNAFDNVNNNDVNNSYPSSDHTDARSQFERGQADYGVDDGTEDEVFSSGIKPYYNPSSNWLGEHRYEQQDYDYYPEVSQKVSYHHDFSRKESKNETFIKTRVENVNRVRAVSASNSNQFAEEEEDGSVCKFDDSLVDNLFHTYSTPKAKCDRPDLQRSESKFLFSCDERDKRRQSPTKRKKVHQELSNNLLGTTFSSMSDSLFSDASQISELTTTFGCYSVEHYSSELTSDSEIGSPGKLVVRNITKERQDLLKLERGVESCDKLIIVKCSNRLCGQKMQLVDAKKIYKTCHHCYTYYCSRECRQTNWPKHKKKCPLGQFNSLCKRILFHCRYNQGIQNELSRLARRGYLSCSKGVVVLDFPSADAGYRFIVEGLDSDVTRPIYLSQDKLTYSNMKMVDSKVLSKLSYSYNPDLKFVLAVSINIEGEFKFKLKTKTILRNKHALIRKCAKVTLSPVVGLDDPDCTLPRSGYEPLILQVPPGQNLTDAQLSRRDRQISFINIQAALRERGVSLRHFEPSAYQKLCKWVDEGTHIGPITLYPTDAETGKTFLCLILPNSESDLLDLEQSSAAVETVDLDAELENLIKVVEDLKLKSGDNDNNKLSP